jgi:hypothetical protein
VTTGDVAVGLGTSGIERQACPGGGGHMQTIEKSDPADGGKGAMPSGVSGRVSVFDRFASTVSSFVSRAWFFLFCVLLVVLGTVLFPVG